MKRSESNNSTSRTLIAALQIAGVAASLGVAGCATTKSDAAWTAKTSLDMHPVKVHQDSARLEIAVEPSDTVLKPDDLRALKSFVADYKDRGRGAMVMSVPSGGKADAAAIAVSDDLQRNLFALLPGTETIASGKYNSDGEAAPIVLSFERYVADVKDCPSNGVSNAAVSWDNKPSAGFGCAVNSNIAMMLADPGDVVAPPDMSASDANRRATVFDKYRKGEPTTSQRSREERGAISTAVNE